MEIQNSKHALCRTERKREAKAQNKKLAEHSKEQTWADLLHTSISDLYLTISDLVAARILCKNWPEHIHWRFDACM